MDTLIYLAIGVLAFGCLVTQIVAINSPCRGTSPNPIRMPVPGDFISDDDENLRPPSGQRVGSVRHSTLGEPPTVTTTTLQTPLSQPLEGIDQTQYSTPVTQSHPGVPTVLTTLPNHPPPVSMQSKWKLSPSLSGVDISPGSLSHQKNFHNPSILPQMHSIIDASDSNHHPLAVRPHIQALASEDIATGRTADSACLSSTMVNIHDSQHELSRCLPPLLPMDTTKTMPWEWARPLPLAIGPLQMVNEHDRTQTPKHPPPTISQTTTHFPMPGTFPMGSDTGPLVKEECKVDQVPLYCDGHSTQKFSLPLPALNPDVPRSSFNVPGVFWKPSLLPLPTLDPKQPPFPPARRLSLITPPRDNEHIDTFVPRTKMEYCQTSSGKDMQLEYDSPQQSVMPPSRIDLAYRRESFRTNDENSGEFTPLLKRNSNLVSVNVEYPSLGTSVPCQNIGKSEVVHDPSLQGLSFHSPLLLKLNFHSNSQSQFRVEFSPLDQQNNNFSTSFQFVPGPMALLNEETPSRIRPEFESSKEATIGTALPTRAELGQDSIRGSPTVTSLEVQDLVNDVKQIEGLQRGVGCRIPPESVVTSELDGKRQRSIEAAPVKKSKYPISLLPTVHTRLKPSNPSKYLDRQIPPESGKKGQWSGTVPDQKTKSFKSSSFSIINPHCEQNHGDLKPTQLVTSSEYLNFNGKEAKKADSEVQGHASPKRSSIFPGQPLGRWLRNKMNSNTRGNTLLEGISTPGLKPKLPKPNPPLKLKIRKQASGAHNTFGEQVVTVLPAENQISEASTEGELAVPSTISSRPHPHTISIPAQSVRNCATCPSIQPSRIPIRSRSSPTEYSKKILESSSRQNPPLPSIQFSDQCFHAPNEIENYVDEDDDGGIKNSRTWHTFSSSPWRKRSKREVDSGSLRVRHLRQLYLSKVCQSSGGIPTDPVVNDREHNDDQHDCFL